MPEDRVFDFRIKYNAGADHSALDSYHYFNAYNAEQALQFHQAMVEKKQLEMQTISVEKYNPYSKIWELSEIEINDFNDLFQS
jgi:hypothetical protein